MLNAIDNFLNKITMYRLVLYYLIFLLTVAFILANFNILHYHPIGLIFTALVLVAACWIINAVFARIFDAHANAESAYITAFILALIIPPSSPLPFLLWVSVLAMASKYILAIGKKHVFNPTAIAVVITSFALGESASWWVGTISMLPFVLIGGILVVRKISRFDLILAFFACSLTAIFLMNMMGGLAPLTLITRIFADTPILFFALIMLTEPSTTPPLRIMRIVYGAIVGILFVPGLHTGPLYSTPELALVIGNIFSYFVSPKGKYLLTLENKTQLAPDMYDLAFTPDRKFLFRPGQYLEWTLGHRRPDTRGNRRYFTIASSPAEDAVRLGVKFHKQSSSFKKALIGMKTGETIVASQLAGEFTLPRDTKKKLVFIAGGIGVTPFRSMVRDLLDRRETRPITMFYSTNTTQEIAYKDVFDAAEKELGIKTIYTLTDSAQIPFGWNGERGFVTSAMIQKYVPDYAERMFYISGPRTMIVSFERTLHDMGIHPWHIKTDFFPGFA